MKVEIINQKENKIFDRDEIKALLKYSKSSTPTLASIQAFMAKMLKTTPEHVEILKVNGLKGMEAAIADIIFWKNKKVEDLTKPKVDKGSEKPKSEEDVKTKSEEKKENGEING